MEPLPSKPIQPQDQESDQSPSPLPADAQIKHADSLTYWNSISPDVNGMLGGYPQISRIDLQGSKNFISKLYKLKQRTSSRLSNNTASPTQTTTNNNNTSTTTSPPATKKLKLAVDCGAGIGRITNGLLSHLCEKIDIVEPIPKFASVLSSPTSPLKLSGQLGDLYITGLESWTPPPEKKYDLIWNQWCVGHLTDQQLISYLERAAKSLSEDGWMVVKENLSTRDFGEDIFDELDSSVTRSDGNFKRIFELAGLKVVRAEVQGGFPRSLGLYPVKMYALRPK